MRRLLSAGLVTIAATTMLLAQGGGRPPSPAGSSATQVGGKWTESKNQQGQVNKRYEGGKWIEITYGRPILKGRTNIFGSGADYGKEVNAGAPIWRAGANVSTRLKTEVPLQIGGKPVAAGEYSLFIDLKPNDWTLVVSSWPAQQTYDPNNKEALWGGYNYTPDKDVARVKMTLGKLPVAFDQLTWDFVDMSQSGGKLALMWDTVIATAPFTVGK